MRSIFKKISNNLDLTFFYLFILSIPLETKLVFLSKDSYFTGAFVHYTTFFLYLSDIFFILALFFWILKRTKNKYRNLPKINRYNQQNTEKCHSELVSESEKSPVNYINRFRNKFGMTRSWFKIIKICSLYNENTDNKHKTPSKQNIIYYLLFFFLICAVLSIFSTKNNLIGIYQVLKLFEFILLFILAGKLINSLKKLYFCFILILSTGFTQAIISVAQYYKQSDLGFKWLGEPILSPDLAGVAKIVVDGEKIIRAYSTFPHPNVLAGFLLMSLFISFYFLLFHVNARRRHVDVSPSCISVKAGIQYLSHFKYFITQNWRFLLLIILISVQFLAFILTFSRTAWLAGLFSLFCFIILHKIVSRKTITIPARIATLIRQYIQNKHLLIGNDAAFSDEQSVAGGFALFKRKFTSLIIIILIISCFSVMLLPQISTRFEINKNDQAISDRFLFNSFAFEMIKKSPFLGAGMGNFVLNICPVEETSSEISEKQFNRRRHDIVSPSDEINYSFNGKEKVPPLNLPLIKGGKEKRSSLESWQYQPVHNFYLLIATEIGIIGLILFIFFIFKVLKIAYLKARNQIVPRETIFTQHISLCTAFLLPIFLGFLFIGLFDHYFWTIQQGQLTFWLILGLLVASCKINETC